MRFKQIMAPKRHKTLHLLSFPLLSFTPHPHCRPYSIVADPMGHATKVRKRIHMALQKTFLALGRKGLHKHFP